MMEEEVLERLIEKNFLAVRESDEEIEFSKEFKEYIKNGQELIRLELKDPKLFAGFAEGDFKDEKKARYKLTIRLFTWLYFCFENQHDVLNRELKKTIWDKRHKNEALEDIMGLVQTHMIFNEEEGW